MRLTLHTALLLACLFSINMRAQVEETPLDFHSISIRDGLAGNQVNVITKTGDGYIWIGTTSGLSRFDGYHCRNFFAQAGNPLALGNDCVLEIMEDRDGKLWIETSVGYSLYDPLTESFDSNPLEKLESNGIKGYVRRIFIDSKKRMWAVAPDQGFYLLDLEKSGQARLISKTSAPFKLPDCNVTDMKEKDGQIVMLYDDGSLVWLDAGKGSIVKTDRYLAENVTFSGSCSLDIDQEGNYYVEAEFVTFVRDSRDGLWGEIPQWLTKRGFTPPPYKLIVSSVCQDASGDYWMATNHEGLVKLSMKDKTITQFKNDREKNGSLPDNTISTLMADDNGAIWIGTYKNGVGYYWNGVRIFRTLALGDVCTMVEDSDGSVWCGTNDSGIVRYDPATGEKRQFRQAETHLLTDVVVCSMRAADGTLWFGSFNGGLTSYKDGVWKAYHKSPDGLSSNDIWALAEDGKGNLVIGTLDAGIQIMDPKESKFTSYNLSNSELPSDNVASLFRGRQQKMLIGHSNYFSVFDLNSRKFTNYEHTKSGELFANTHVEQIYEDSRGLVWIATPSGLNIYDMLSDQLYTIGMNNGLGGHAAISIQEDTKEQMWVATDRGVVRFKVGKTSEGKWTFDPFNFNFLDGLQRRQLNGRSMLVTSSGDVLIGGQDGVSVYSEEAQNHQLKDVHTVFSSLNIFDQPIAVGEEYDGRVILDEALDRVRKVSISHKDKFFTINLASNVVEMPNRFRFYYRMKGLTDKWMLTAPGNSELEFTNLSPGTYTLQVRLVGNGGEIFEHVDELVIEVTPPFYRTIWMYLLYALLLAAVLYWVRRIMMRRQQAKLHLMRIRQQAHDNQHLNEMKMRFFTNASHELRTPLTLVISPLKQMMEQEKEPEKKQKLAVIHRNANKLLILVNQLLDMRKIEVNGASLNLKTGDIVLFVKNVCDSFQQLMSNKVALTFFSHVDSLVMSFDDDKVGKIMNNLLSNAFKFTESGGRVDVSLRTLTAAADNDSETLEIKVADTGRGISDEDKKHVFERFYQADNQTENPFGGSGIGLNLVAEFVKLHEGTITVDDNPGGGTVFIIHLPVRKIEAEAMKQTDVSKTETAEAVEETTAVNQKNETEHEAEKGENGRYEVLIVDDNPDFLQFMTDTLKDKYHVRRAEDGKQALQAISEHHPDIILSDVMMPEMDGNELCSAVKNNPETAKIPFVLLTARMAQEQKISSLERGADDYITKPFDLDLLHLRIDNLIKWSHSGGKTAKLEPKVKELEITSLDEKLVNDATEYVEQNLTEVDLNVETLSAALNMSRSYLYKRILSLTGHTPSEFIRLIRLRHAEQLLRKSQLSVSEITYKVGFPNTRSFSKFFKEMYGILPSQYKDAHGV